MTIAESEKLAAGLGCTAWGYFFLLFNFEINGFNILPQFVGYALFFRGLEHFCEAGRGLAGLKPLCLLLVVYNLLGYVPMLGVLLGGMFFVLLAVAAGIYFHFQLLSEMAQVAAECEPPEEGGQLADRLLRWRAVYVVLLTVSSVGVVFFRGDLDSWLVWPLLLLAFVGLVAEIWIMLALFKLRRMVREEAKIPLA